MCYTTYYLTKDQSLIEMLPWLDIFVIIVTVAINLPAILIAKSFSEIAATESSFSNINCHEAAYNIHQLANEI